MFYVKAAGRTESCARIAKYVEYGASDVQMSNVRVWLVLVVVVVVVGV